MKKIVLYVFLAFCLVGIVPLVLSLTSQTSNSSSSSSITSNSSSVATYSLTATSDEHSTIVVYDSDNTAVTSLQSGQEYTISVSVDEHYSLSSLKVNNVSYQNNSIIVPTSNITINSVSALQTFTLTKTENNCTISVLNANSESVSSLTYGQTYTISVSANSGYGISSITMNNQTIQNNSTFTASQNVIINVTTDLIYTITPSLTNITANENNVSSILNGGSAILTYQVVNGGYSLPSSISVTGATGVWDSTNGTLTLSNPTDNISFSISGVPKTYSITYHNYACGIYGNAPHSIQFANCVSMEYHTVNNGYSLPDTITVIGTDYYWDKSSGTLDLWNPSNDIVISVTAIPKTLTLTTNGNNCTISVLNSNSESVNSLTGGQTYTISVTADNGYKIDNITLNGNVVENNSTFLATSNNTINVTTSLITYTLTTSGSNCTISVLNSSSVSVSSLTYGQAYTISVTVSNGYQIDSITLNGTSVSNNSTFTASQNTTINVTTSLITYTLTTSGSNCTISVLNSSSESVSSLIYGQTYTISVNVSNGYQIDSITLNGTSVSNNSTFTASQNTTINVTTSLITYTLTTSGSNCTISVLNSSSESVSSLISGQIYTISVIASSGYQIDSITLNGTSVSNNSTFTATQNTIINVTTCVYINSVFGLNSLSIINSVSNIIANQNLTAQQVADTYGWNLGDTIDITLKNDEQIQMRIIGINHDTLSSDHVSKAGLTLQMVNCLSTKYVMNSDNTVGNGWAYSDLRTTMSTLKSLLPDEWQSMIKTVDKVSGSSSSSGCTSHDDLFLLSEKELTGNTSYSVCPSSEGSQYAYWSQHSSTSDLTKYRDVSGTLTASHWWLRSAYNGGGFCAVASYGCVVRCSANTACGVSFAFCI